MRAENPVFQASVPIIGRGWFVTRYADVVTVAKDDRFSRDIQPLVIQHPDTLDLARDPDPHVAFGQGRHFCLGASLARMEAHVALTTLFARVPGLRLTQPAESLRWRKILPLRGLLELPVAGLN